MPRDKRTSTKYLKETSSSILHYFIRLGCPVRSASGHRTAGISSMVGQRTRLPCTVHTCHPPAPDSASKTTTKNKQANKNPSQKAVGLTCFCVRKGDPCIWLSLLTDGSLATQRDSHLLKTTGHITSRAKTSAWAFGFFLMLLYHMLPP